jgi:hypothetical protein
MRILFLYCLFIPVVLPKGQTAPNGTQEQSSIKPKDNAVCQINTALYRLERDTTLSDTSLIQKWV